MADKTDKITTNVLERNCVKSANTQATISSQGYVVNVRKIHKLQLECMFTRISERIKLFNDKEIKNIKLFYNKILKV